MRTFNFKARNIGNEKYLTYTMGEECELDEDVLDYCEENTLKELVGIIYEEDDDYDYLTYDITGRVSLDDYIKTEMSCEKVLNILRSVADGLISLKEQTIHLSYILLNKGFVFVNEDMSVSFICLPIESKAAVSVEFKGFVRQLLANMRYDVDEDLSYVGKLLTYINGDSFNLRGLIGLSEALMDEAGINHDEAGTIESDGVEVVNAAEPDTEETPEGKVADFMNSLDEGGERLPEIGDDEEDEAEPETEALNDGELDSILPGNMKTADEDTGHTETTGDESDAGQTEAKEPEESDVNVTSDEPVADDNDKQTVAPKTKETDVDVIKDRIKKLVGDKTTAPAPTHTITSLEELDQLLDSKPPVVKKNVVKVNRAAIIQNVAAEHNDGEETVVESDDDKTQIPVIEDIYDDMNIEKGEEEEKPRSRSILSRTVGEAAKTNTLLNAPKAIPYLIRVNTEERIMLNKPVFKLGKASRGVDYTVDGNGAVSRLHAVIMQKDGVCYIRDNKSTNHTYVNDKEVPDGVEEILTHDSAIKLGDEEFIFKIR